jgi:UDP-glucose 4-epimerase
MYLYDLDTKQLKNQITKGDYATVVGIFKDQYESGKKLTVVSPGTQSRDFTHVHDIVDGVVKATSSNQNGEWHLRSGETITLQELAELFETEWEFIPERRGERVGATESDSAATDKLGWKPKYNLKEYINKIIENGK